MKIELNGVLLSFFYAFLIGFYAFLIGIVTGTLCGYVIVALLKGLS